MDQQASDTAEDDNDICICGANDFAISATLISCRRCNRLWGRVNERWVYDITTDPDYGKNAVKDDA